MDSTEMADNNSRQPVGSCAHKSCGRTLLGNPNDKQCNDCCELYCSEHQRVMTWGERLCVTCRPPVRRRRTR